MDGRTDIGGCRVAFATENTSMFLILLLSGVSTCNHVNFIKTLLNVIHISFSGLKIHGNFELGIH